MLMLQALPLALCSSYPALGSWCLNPGFWLGFGGFKNRPPCTIYKMLFCVFLLGLHCGISLGRGSPKGQDPLFFLFPELSILPAPQLTLLPVGW